MFRSAKRVLRNTDLYAIISIFVYTDMDWTCAGSYHFVPIPLKAAPKSSGPIITGAYGRSVSGMGRLELLHDRFASSLNF